MKVKIEDRKEEERCEINDRLMEISNVPPHQSRLAGAFPEPSCRDQPAIGYHYQTHQLCTLIFTQEEEKDVRR